MKVNFYDVVDVISGGTPRTDVGEFWNGEIPWLSVVDFAKSVKYVYDTEKHITELGLKNSNTKLLNIDDIIISARGTVGAIAMLKIPMAFNQSCFGLRAKREFMNQDYLFYFLKYYMENLKKKTQGSVFSTINLETFRMIDFELPDTNTQIKISKILSCLDSKIENNNKINAELESMAKTLYDYWFLQFDFPDENGKPYRQNGGAFEYNKQLNRNIPVGWQVKTVKHCVKKISTGLNPRKNFVLGKGTNKYLTIKNIDNGRLLFDSCDLIDDEALKIIHARSDISVGDILFTSIDPVGRLYYILEKPEGWDINESVFSVRTNTQIVSNEYLYSVFDSDYFKAQTLPLMTGSVQKGIRIAALESIPLVVPEARIIKAYTEKVRSIYERKAKIEKESIELAALRDFLLPLLMNGQVTVEKKA